MRIEVAGQLGDPQKTKGDLFETLSKDLLEALGYEVIEEIRITGAELDLLCKHKVNGRQVYVECKAHKEKLSATVLRQLLGTVAGYDYSEGWIISTSDFGKEATGFAEMWKSKPAEQSSKLSFYTPDKVIASLRSASVVCDPPIGAAVEIIGGAEHLGEWTLLVGSFGRYWSVYTLSGGAPYGVLLFNAVTGKPVSDVETINNIAKLDCSLTEYDLKVGIEKLKGDVLAPKKESLAKVVEVQIGDSWDDYRPARPQDFVGRDSLQKEIIQFLGNVKDKITDTRIFAITGHSGLGKSSLIAKLRERSSNKFYKKKFFTYAVDIRGAKSPAYISSSLLKCLEGAQKSGFGDPVALQLTDPAEPLSSPSIQDYLNSLEKSGQVICLVFDQFEELYSKPELFNVFSAAKDLMLDVASSKANIVLGFAWKTDSTTQQDHPAYHLWHELSDHRKAFKLDVFDNGEITKSITKFEKEVGFKLPAETRHQIQHSCQGFPWLLKKLCINLYENSKKGEGTESILADLDVGRLFESDLDNLTPAEHSCIKIVAQKAPADWSEIIEISGVSVLNNLVHKRLVVKSGDRLNVYWDIFKDYLLTGNVPVVPFNYIPTSDLSSMLKVAASLERSSFVESSSIAVRIGLKEKTVWNIGADLVMFGLAERNGVNFKQHRDVGNYDEYSLLVEIRQRISKHSLKLALFKSRSGKTVSQKYIVEALKKCLVKQRFNDKTWSIYTNRLIKILVNTGYLVNIGGQYVVQDIGAPVIESFRLGRSGKRRGFVFPAHASPASVCGALHAILDCADLDFLMANGYRNSFSVLKRFELAGVTDGNVFVNKDAIEKFGGIEEAVWTSAKNEPVISVCVDWMAESSSTNGLELGDYISDKYGLSWTPGSKQRNGNALKQWSIWVNDGVEGSKIPEPPGRKK